MTDLEEGECLPDDVLAGAVDFEVDPDLGDHDVEYHEVVAHVQPLRKPRVDLHILSLVSEYSQLLIFSSIIQAPADVILMQSQTLNIISNQTPPKPAHVPSASVRVHIDCQGQR